MKTTVLKRKALVLSMAMAFIGAITLTQCKKEPPIVTPTEDPTEIPTDTVTTPVGEIVHITLRVNQSNDEKLDVDPPHVYFETGDKIHVASDGKYVGTMTYSSETRLFSANIIASQVASDQQLHFYLLGNKTPDETLTAGTTTSCTINIGDQTGELPVVSYAPSNEKFNETTEFTAILRNQCALVKFNVDTPSNSPICITGMNNKVTVSFQNTEDPMTPSVTGGGVITLSPGSGEKWAILLPHEAMEAGEEGSLYSKDGLYKGIRPVIPVIEKNAYITTPPIALSVTTNVDPNSLSYPEITTISISATDVTASTATCGGTISGNGYGIITGYGISYSTTSGFGGSTGTHVEGWDLNNNVGNFTVHLTGLEANTTYYYRAYATNAKGTVYGDIKSFQTSVASGPFVVTTSDVTNISRTSAVGGGEVTSDGGLSVIDRGICWSTSDTQPEYINDNIPHASSGVGLGNYSVTMTGLQPATTYYVWAYATNSGGTTAFGVRKQFSTLYEVYVSANPSDGGTVTGGGTYSGGACTVTAEPAADYLFINWTENNVVVVNDQGNPVPASYTFTLNSDRNLVANFGLKRTISVSANPTEGGTVYIGTVGTTSAICPQGTNCTVTATPAEDYMFINWTENGTEVSTDAEYTFTIPAADRNLVANFGLKRTISVSANPTEGGMAYIGTDGTGTSSAFCAQGTNCTVTAEPADDCYDFVNWTKNGVPVSVENPYTFTVTESEEYVANFGPKNYTITISANPTTYGSVEFVDNNGPFSCNDLCTVKATANPGYVFENWTENDEVVVDIEGNPLPASFNFVVTSNRTLVANFIPVPEGAIGGLFSVNSFQKVFFSKGNLQYTKSTGIWSFMENQYDRVETSGQDVGTDYANQDVVSLFGWGTSGYNHNNSCYQPWRTDNSNANYYAYNDPFSDLESNNGQAEWGYNAISNGGNTQNSGWRTLTGGYGEWNYLFFMRGTTTGLRFVMATVNGVKGVILFPDNWNESISLNNPNGGNYGSNIITASEWTNSFEATGAVFLPAAGYRNGTVVTDFDSEGSYWTSSSSHDNEHAYSLNFISNDIIINFNRNRCNGFSVRLVKDVY